MLAPQLFAFARLRAVLQGPSASLHWDGLLDLLIPTDPKHALIFFPLSCLTHTWPFFLSHSFSSLFCLYLPLCVSAFAFGNWSSEQNMTGRIPRHTVHFLFFLFFLWLANRWNLCFVPSSNLHYPPPCLCTEGTRVTSFASICEGAEREMHLGFSRIPDLCWWGRWLTITPLIIDINSDAACQRNAHLIYQFWWVLD